MKKIELIIEINSDGKLTVTPKGTSGKECLDLMSFLDKIEGLTVLETVANEDMKQNAQIVLKNSISDHVKKLKN